MAFIQVVSMTHDGVKILLVVHDPLESALLANSLSVLGSEIITCREIEAAEALLPQIKAHVLITDLSFPPLFGAEGIKLIQHMKARFPNMITIGLANRIDDQVDHLFCSVKGGKLFVKPVVAGQLLDFVDQTQGLRPPGRVPGNIHHVSRLEDFLKTESIGSLLQPILGIRKDNDRQILGVESLARAPSNHALWNPEMLFDYADRMEKTFETDSLCIGAALKEASGLSDTLRLFINVRPRSIVQVDFAEQLKKKAREFHFEPKQIILELTEQQTIANLDEFNRSMSSLRESGFGFALDDFGAGYANLDWLQSLKPDFLKLSGVFSRNLDTDVSKQVIIKAATQMARRLSIPTILENIESEAELEKAKSLGVDFGQGYYFYQPKSAKSLKEMIPGFHGAKTLA